MTRRTISARPAFLVLASLLLVASNATAQMSLIKNSSQTWVMATYQGVVDSTSEVAAPMATYFESNIGALAEKYEACPDPPPDQCLVGSCTSGAYQISQFYPAGIQFSGVTGAGWGVPPSGNWSFLSSAYFRFRVDTAFDYQLFVDLDPGDWPSQGTFGGAVTLCGATEHLVYRYQNVDSTTWTGRLGPGEYILEGWSAGGGLQEEFQGAAYFGQWLVTPVPNPIITTQPSDLAVNTGTTAGFSITTSGPAGSYTYAWRKDLTPLANSAHVSGVTTSALLINNASDADSGYYDVVVTGTVNGSPVSEPSRLAHLGIVTTTAVQDQAKGLPALTLTDPSPNPFRLTTSVRYALPNPTRLRAAVYDVAGALVLTLVDEVVSGSGNLTWNGTTQSGAPSPRGIYFLHVEAGGMRQTSKLVLME